MCLCPRRSWLGQQTLEAGGVAVVALSAACFPPVPPPPFQWTPGVSPWHPKNERKTTLAKSGRVH
eukprot:122958-Pelagomonas_calceolata.AAC.1